MFASRYGCVQPRLIRQVMRFSASFIRSGDGETRDSQACRRVHAAMLDKRHSRPRNWSTRPSEDSSWNIMSTQRGICKKRNRIRWFLFKEEGGLLEFVCPGTEPSSARVPIILFPTDAASHRGRMPRNAHTRLYIEILRVNIFS